MITKEAELQRRRRGKIFFHLVGCVVILGLMVRAPVLQAGTTGGVVQELINRKPIGGVQITLDCKRAKSVHGSESVRVVKTTSRPDGHFSFLPVDIQGCGYLLISLSKDGFLEPHQIPGSNIMKTFELNREVPRVLYMVPESEVKMLQLEVLYNQSNSVRLEPAEPMPESDYISVNTMFFESIRIASTSEEIRWVQDRYCKRLATLWSRIPPKEQQTHLAGRYANVVMYPNVIAYCQKKR